MKVKTGFLWGILFAVTGFLACDWNNHTEPELTVNNAEILGQAIFVNQSNVRPTGVAELFVNEGDTIELVMTTALLKQPNYTFLPEDDDVIKIEKDPQDPTRAWAIAVGDSGMTTNMKIVDTGNTAERMLNVQVVKHWADPMFFDFIGSFQGHYYYMSTNIRGWVEAEEICREAGGYMVAINSAEENEFLNQARGRIENVWIGIRLNRSGSSYVITTWANGEEVTLRKFNSTDAGIFAEYYYYMDVNGNWENLHEITYNYFLEME